MEQENNFKSYSSDWENSSWFLLWLQLARREKID